MTGLVNLPITAAKRVPFDYTFYDERADYSSGTWLMHVRNEPGDTGTPLISLGNFASGEGIVATHEDIASPDDPTGATLIEVSAIRIRIAEATIEAVALAADASDPLPLSYDIHFTPSGGTKSLICGGAFTIDPGVTI